jgi:Condensation domain
MRTDPWSGIMIPKVFQHAGRTMVDKKKGCLPRVLDGLSEIMVLSNYPNAKNIMIFGFSLEGQLDTEAMGHALRPAVDSFPQFACSVSQKKMSGKWRMTWSQDQDFKPYLRVSQLVEPDPAVPLQRSLLRHLHHSLEKDWDLLCTVPTEFHAIQVAEDRHTLLALVHHAAADGWTLSLFFKKLLSCYHHVVTGREPEWADEADSAAGAKSRMVELKTGRLHDILFLTRSSVAMCASKPSIPRGNGCRQGPGNHYVKAVLTRDETASIVANLSPAGKPFMDVLVGALGTAVDEWNAGLDVPPGGIAVCVTVQMRGRFGDAEAPSNSSSIIVKSSPHERRSPEKFSRCIAESRKEQFNILHDAKLMKASNTLSDTMRRLPLSLRKRIAHSVCQIPVIPLLIAPFGVMWPELKDGRRTGDSYLTESGDLELTEFHAIPYKLGYHCPLILGAYTFRGKLNLQLMSLVSHYTSSETQRFMDLLVKVILDRPFGAPTNGFPRI